VAAATPPVTGDTRSPAQIRLDGLVEICRRYLEGPDAPTRGGGHPHVLVTVDQHTLGTTGHTGQPGDTSGNGQPGESPGSPGATLSWVGPITGSTARRIACDAQYTRVLIGPDGQIVATGSERRFFTAAQRRAMIARDGDRCATPYCDRPVLWSDGHHLVPVEDGGPTTIANGALPCAAPPAPPRRPLAAEPGTRRPLHPGPPRRAGHRTRTPPTRPQPTPTRATRVIAHSQRRTRRV
jgi:hypothetical protein